MPDIWMDVDTAVTIPVNKVPIVASSDGFTTDETIAWNESGMDLNWNFVTTAGVQTQTNVSPTTTGDYDWTHVGNAMYKIEMTASGGASANNDTEGFGWFSGNADAICPFAGPTIGFRAAALNNALIDGGDTLDVNVTAEANIDFGALKKTSLNAATTDLSAITGDKASYKATGFSTHDAAAVKTAIEIAGSSLAQILTDTGTTLENRQVTIATDAARLTAVRAAILTDWINDGRLDAILDAIKVVTDNLAASATTIVSGTVAATAGSTTTIYSDDITEATGDHYNGRIIIFTSGDMQNQATDITDYVLEGGEGKFTVTATTETAAEDVTFVIV